MSLAERKYIKQIDEMILNASVSKLRKLQELDLKTQLEGSTFYDVFLKSLKRRSILTPGHPSVKKK